MTKSSALFEFGELDLNTLRRYLGASFDSALPQLQMAGSMYRLSAPGTPRPRASLRDLRGFEAALGRAANAIEGVSDDVRSVVFRRYWKHVGAAQAHGSISAVEADRLPDPLVVTTRWISLMHVIVSEAVEDRKRKGRERHSWQNRFLVDGVVDALVRAGVPLSKSRDGATAKVLECVWSAAAAEMCPAELFQYLRLAVDQAIAANGHACRVRKGRRPK